MLPPDLIATLSQAHRRLTPEAWQALTDQLQASPGKPDPVSIHAHTASLANPDAGWMLSDAFRRHTNVSWAEIAAAMSAVAHLDSRSGAQTEIIWSGPANGRFPVRRLEQVLYDLISTASRRIILVTFAAHRVPHLCRHLAQAVERGVEMSLVLERETESEGQLTQDALADRVTGSLPPVRTPSGQRRRRGLGSRERPRLWRGLGFQPHGPPAGA